MRILDRYVAREVAKPILIFFVVLTVIFSAYSATDFLKDASQGLVRVDVMARLVFLKSVIAMEVLLPIATFLTVVVGISKLGANYEITAMSFCGYSRLRLLKALLVLFLFIATLVGFLSIWARPRVYAEIYRLARESVKTLDLEDVKTGVFVDADKGRTVLFVDKASETKRSVFIYQRKSDKELVMAARSVEQVNKSDGMIDFNLHDLELWQIDEESEDLMSVATDQITIPFGASQKSQARRRRKATATTALNIEDDSEDLSEYQWRISRPISTFILGFLAVALSNFVPRRDRYLRLLGAVVVYIVYFNLQAMARTWVERGIVPEVPGLFWVDALVAVVLLAAFIRSRLHQSRPSTSPKPAETTSC